MGFFGNRFHNSAPGRPFSSHIIESDNQFGTIVRFIDLAMRCPSCWRKSRYGVIDSLPRWAHFPNGALGLARVTDEGMQWGHFGQTIEVWNHVLQIATIVDMSDYCGKERLVNQHIGLLRNMPGLDVMHHSILESPENSVFARRI